MDILDDFISTVDAMLDSRRKRHITPTSGNNYNFTQNNYSPKALSRIDIYRQTKNQFSALKGLVET